MIWNSHSYYSKNAFIHLKVTLAITIIFGAQWLYLHTLIPFPHTKVHSKEMRLHSVNTKEALVNTMVQTSK